MWALRGMTPAVGAHNMADSPTATVKERHDCHDISMAVWEMQEGNILWRKNVISYNIMNPMTYTDKDLTNTRLGGQVVRALVLIESCH